MILYALPDFTVMLSWNLMFAGMMHTAPEMFFEDVKADCVYGCFPDCMMNGGRVIPGERASYEQIARTFDAIEEAGLGIRITFTNMLVRPEHFEDASSIADHLNEKRTVVINLESTNKEIARRLVDFLSGVAYANNGQIKRVANSTFIITPYNVDVMGDLLDELENNGVFF